MNFCGTNQRWVPHRLCDMKATIHLLQQAPAKNALYSPSSSSPAETMVFGMLGLAGVIGVAIAVVSGSTPMGLRDDYVLAELRGLPTVRYVRYGQFIADVRPVGTLPHNLSRSETPGATNLIEPGATQKNLARPTNAAPVGPKA